MPTFRNNKKIIREWLSSPNWTQEAPLPEACLNAPEMEIINPLFACLPQGDDMADKAGYALGMLIASLYQKNKEQAQVCIRRFMWHMNEESGNIGWGIPIAFGQSLAQCPALAKTYHNVLISYVHDIMGDSNYCDLALLRITCYKGIHILGLALEEYRERICFILKSSKEDDPACLEMIATILKDFS